MSNNFTTKVSGAGWLCILVKDDKWLPMFELTKDQIDNIAEILAETQTLSFKSQQRLHWLNTP